MPYYQNPVIEREIKRRAREGLVIFSGHAQQRAVEREIDDLEILRCLKLGVLEGEDWNAPFQATTYRMLRKQGRSWLCVVVALTATHDIVVTTFRRVPA